MKKRTIRRKAMAFYSQSHKLKKALKKLRRRSVGELDYINVLNNVPEVSPEIAAMWTNTFNKEKNKK